MKLRFSQDKGTQISKAIPKRIATKMGFSFSADIT